MSDTSEGALLMTETGERPPASGPPAGAPPGGKNKKVAIILAGVAVVLFIAFIIVLLLPYINGGKKPGGWLELAAINSGDITPRPATHYWDCCLPSFSNWDSAEAGKSMLNQGITPLPACSSTNFNKPLWSPMETNSAACPASIFNCVEKFMPDPQKTKCSTDGDCWQSSQHLKCFNSLCEDGLTSCSCETGSPCDACPTAGKCVDGTCHNNCCGDYLWGEKCCGTAPKKLAAYESGTDPDPPCYTMNFPIGDGSDKTIPMCVQLGLSTSGCRVKTAADWTSSMCAGGGHSQLPYVEAPIYDMDSGIRIFAATQLTNGEGWIPSGCMCYEAQLTSMEDYEGLTSVCNQNTAGCDNGNTKFCSEDGTGCLSWPRDKTLIVMVTNEGGMGTDTQPGTQFTRKALFDFSVPGGGFGDFNGCSGSWPGVYEDEGGPCNPKENTDTCKVFGGFLYKTQDVSGGGGPEYCESIGENFPEAVEACKWLFGVSSLTKLNPWPAMSDRSIGNPFITRIRSVTCPESMREKTGCPAYNCVNSECVEPEILLKQSPNPPI